MQSNAETVAAYLDALPEDRRASIEAVRRVVLRNLPEGVVETMNWGMICYEVPLSIQPDTYNGQPLMFAALASQKNHMALYLTGIYMDPARRDAFEQEFRARGKKLDAGKSCVRFRHVDELALDVIGETIGADSVDDFVGRYEAGQSARKVRKQSTSKTRPAVRKASGARKKTSSGRRTK